MEEPDISIDQESKHDSSGSSSESSSSSDDGDENADLVSGYLQTKFWS